MVRRESTPYVSLMTKRDLKTIIEDWVVDFESFKESLEFITSGDLHSGDLRKFGKGESTITLQYLTMGAPVILASGCDGYVIDILGANELSNWLVEKYFDYYIKIDGNF